MVSLFPEPHPLPSVMASRRTKKPALKKEEPIDVDETPDSNDASVATHAPTQSDAYFTLREFDITALIALKGRIY